MNRAKRKTALPETKLNIWVFASVAFLFAMGSIFLAPGYKAEVEEQRYYLPPIMQQMDSALYERDFLVSASQAESSLFDEFIAKMAFDVPANIPSALFWVMFLARMMFFLGISLIAFAFTRNTFFALLVPLAFIIGYQDIVSSAMPPKNWLFSLSLELHPRSLATPMALLALGLFFLDRFRAALILLSLGFLVHPLTVLPITVALFIYTLVTEIIIKRNFRFALWYLLPLTSYVLMDSIVSTSGAAVQNDIFLQIDSAWLAFGQAWTPWVFFADYLQLTLALGVLLPLLLLFLISVISNRIDPPMLGKITLVTMVIVLLTVVGVIAFDRFGLIFFGQLQLHRGLHLLTILLPLAALSVALLEIFYRDHDPLNKGVFLLLFLVITLGGQGLWLPITLAICFAAFYLVSEAHFRSQPALLTAYTFFAVVLIVKTIISHPSAHTQLNLLQTFFHELVTDPVAALNLFLLWIIPIAAAAALLFGIVISWQWCVVSQQRSLLTIVGSKLTALAILLFFLPTYGKIVEPHKPHNQISYWIRTYVGDEELLFVSKHAEAIGVEARNHLGKNVFFTESGQSLGLYNRSYALEWEHRRQIRQDPDQFMQALADYDIDYYIFRNDELPVEGLSSVFKGEQYVVMQAESVL